MNGTPRMIRLAAVARPGGAGAETLSADAPFDAVPEMVRLSGHLQKAIADLASLAKPFRGKLTTVRTDTLPVDALGH